MKGQRHAKRALEVAAADGQSVLLVGPPGAGKRSGRITISRAAHQADFPARLQLVAAMPPALAAGSGILPASATAPAKRSPATRAASLRLCWTN